MEIGPASSTMAQLAGAGSRAEIAVTPVLNSVDAETAGVRTFYDEVGWTRGADGRTDDTRRFGVREDGPIRRAMHQLREARIQQAIAGNGASATLLECGCGGNPALFLAQACGVYTGVDFSRRGLDLAQSRLSALGIASAALVQAELSALPFAVGVFDALYSAHALYHIPSAEGQQQALREMMRVVKPNGCAVFVLANPRPLLFPIRLLRRLLADAPVISSILNAIRRAGPLPYQPMTLGWMKRRLKSQGSVRITGYAIASIWFNQHISEQRGLGRLAWKVLAGLERRVPGLSARLGNYVVILVRKHGPEARLMHGG